jgi:hypothetical protein
MYTLKVTHIHLHLYDHALSRESQIVVPYSQFIGAYHL